MIKVRVPATSANIGPGFDSMGVALTLYNYVSVQETDKEGLLIEILDESSAFLPKDENNLIYRAMQRVFERAGYKPKGLHIVLENNIPVTRGLGSSSAGIIGGMVAANALIKNKLPQNEILKMAAEMEGHPDNVTPALLGGFTVNVQTKYSVKYVKSEISNDDICFAALMPNFFLQTKKSRNVLPKSVKHTDAVYNAGHSALLAASLMTGKYENIRTAIGDKLHQRYRRSLIPNMDVIFRLCYDNKALGVYLSGAGPTIIAIVSKDNKAFESNISNAIKNKSGGWKLAMLSVDNEGAVVI